MKKPSTGDPLSTSFEMHASCGLLGELRPPMKWEPDADLEVRNILPPQPSPGGTWEGSAGPRGALASVTRQVPGTSSGCNVSRHLGQETRAS